MTEAVEAPAPPAAPARSRRRIITVVALVIVLAVVATGIGVFFYWRDSPNLFRAAGDAEGFQKPIIGQTNLFGTMLQADTTRAIDVRSITPVISMNTAKATITLVECVRRPNGELIGAGSLSDLHANCSSVTPFRPGRYQMLFGSQTQFYVEITTHQAGTVWLNGFRVRYNDGIRRGDQVSGIDVWVGPQPAS